ncbi:MAG TPA: YfcE family phosphodiesterase [Clostridia bacterium]|nr:YfcE family phosphodiesterase [Clostridia bacterium]
MRILVVSDSHGDEFTLKYVIQQQPLAEVIIHLGDGCNDMENVKSSFPNKKIVQIKGNCDFCCRSPLTSVEQFCGKKIFCTHGHAENVKFTQNELILKAQKEGADIALYGHTHVPVIDYVDGLYLFNPGSVRQGEYGFIDITQSGIVCNNLVVNFI